MAWVGESAVAPRSKCARTTSLQSHWVSFLEDRIPKSWRGRLILPLWLAKSFLYFTEKLFHETVAFHVFQSTWHPRQHNCQHPQIWCFEVVSSRVGVSVRHANNQPWLVWRLWRYCWRWWYVILTLNEIFLNFFFLAWNSFSCNIF